MIILYYVQDKTNKQDYPTDSLLYSDKNKLEDMMKKLSDGFVTLYDNENYEIRTTEVDDKCNCDNYMQTTMFLIKVKDNGCLQIVGSDNYIGIHNKVGMPFTIDIESYTDGNYQLISEEYFNNHYEIKIKQ